ncbi:MAG: hypothetical protein ACTHJM_16430 [Marmoricola sp.]
MSLLITRHTPMHYDERIKRADRLGIYVVAFYVGALIVIASFGPQMMNAAAPARRVVGRIVAAVSAPLSNVPLDAAFVAIISVVVVAIGLAVRVYLADEDREVFDVR